MAACREKDTRTRAVVSLWLQQQNWAEEKETNDEDRGRTLPLVNEGARENRGSKETLAVVKFWFSVAVFCSFYNLQCSAVLDLDVWCLATCMCPPSTLSLALFRPRLLWGAQAKVRVNPFVSMASKHHPSVIHRKNNPRVQSIHYFHSIQTRKHTHTHTWHLLVCFYCFVSFFSMFNVLLFLPFSAAKWTDGGSNNGNSSSYVVSPLRHNEVNFKSSKLLLLFTLTFTRIPPVPPLSNRSSLPSLRQQQTPQGHARAYTLTSTTTSPSRPLEAPSRFWVGCAALRGTAWHISEGKNNNNDGIELQIWQMSINLSGSWKQ